MVTNEMNPYLSIIVMLLVGSSYRSMAGILDRLCANTTVYCNPCRNVSIPGTFQCCSGRYDSGSYAGQFPCTVNNYIPDFFGMEGFNMTCFLVGVVVCVLYVFMVLKGRASRAKKGYRVEPLAVC